jgi:hypothetical protein
LVDTYVLSMLIQVRKVELSPSIGLPYPYTKELV